MQKTIALHDYEDKGGKFLEMKTPAWVDARLAASRVAWIEFGVSVRLCNRPAPITAAVRRPPAPRRAWGVRSVHSPLWCALGDISMRAPGGKRGRG